MELVRTFRSRIGALDADGLVPGTGYVTTKSGATMTSDNILEALRIQEEKKRDEEAAKAAAALRKDLEANYPESARKIAHLMELASARNQRRANCSWRKRRQLSREKRRNSGS